jgi:isochorismate synthase
MPRTARRVADERLASAARTLDRALDPLDFLAAFPGRERFLWARDVTGESIAAVGAVLTIDAVGDDRFSSLVRDVAALPFAPAPIEGVLVGGFAFDPSSTSASPWDDFPAARLVLPQLALVRRGGEARLVATVSGTASGARAGAEQTLERALGELGRSLARVHGPRLTVARAKSPAFRVRALAPTASWRAAVCDALAELEVGRLDKVVLARAVEVDAGCTLDPLRVAARLRAAHPGCAVFALLRGASAFVGATPEVLVRVEGDRVATAAVAGSAPRGERVSEDRAHAAALRASVKERTEHALVVGDLVQRLRPLCRRLTVPKAPRLLRTSVVQHLWTPLLGRLRPGIGVLDVAGALHPTPAICGAPRDAARTRLLAGESSARGWYGGGVGWIDAADGRSGEIGVAIRTALLRGERAVLHAGAGLVRGSRWETELEETRLKLRAMLHALLEV